MPMTNTAGPEGDSNPYMVTKAAVNYSFSQAPACAALLRAPKAAQTKTVAESIVCITELSI